MSDLQFPHDAAFRDLADAQSLCQMATEMAEAAAFQPTSQQRLSLERIASLARNAADNVERAALVLMEPLPVREAAE
jgi:hypothetical protein